MIRINLLAAERKRVKKKAVAFGRPARRSTVGCSLILVARRGCSSAGATGRSSRSRRGSTAKSPTAQQETARLHAVIQQVQQFEQQQGAAAAARRADRAAAQGPDRPGAHARSDQPRAAADAVADRVEADRRRACVIDGRCTALTGLTGLRRATSKPPATSRSRSTSSARQTEASRDAAGRADQVQHQGAVPAAPEATLRRRPRAGGGYAMHVKGRSGDPDTAQCRSMNSVSRNCRGTRRSAPSSRSRSPASARFYYYYEMPLQRRHAARGRRSSRRCAPTSTRASRRRSSCRSSAPRSTDLEGAARRT